jgi:hypothetical protein
MSSNLETRVASLEKSLRIYQFLFSGAVLIVAGVLFTSFNKRQQVPDNIVS